MKAVKFTGADIMLVNTLSKIRVLVNLLSNGVQEVLSTKIFLALEDLTF